LRTLDKRKVFVSWLSRFAELDEDAVIVDFARVIDTL